MRLSLRLTANPIRDSEPGMMRRKRNLVVLGAASVVAALALSACGTQQPGAAAVVGTAPIAEGVLTAEVEQVVTGLGVSPNEQVNRVMLQRLVLEELVDQLSAEHEVTVSEGEIQTFIDEQAARAGGVESFNATLLRNGVPAESVSDAVRMSIQLDKLGQKLAPGQSGQEQQVAVSMAAINLAGQEGVEVNPRFGAWEPSSLQIGASPDTLSQPELILETGMNPIPEAQ